VQIAGWHVEAAHGVDQRREDFSFAKKRFTGQGLCSRAIKELRVACDRFIKCRAPFGEAALFGVQTFAFVSDVVDKTHEGIERGETIALGLRQEIEGVIKIAASSAGDLMAVLVGLSNGRCCAGVVRRGPGSRRRGHNRSCSSRRSG
jgi:hypothetical protein